MHHPQAAVATRLFVVAVRVGKGVVHPGHQRQPCLDGTDQHRRPPQPRQVEVAAIVLDQLPDRHMITPPQRDAVQFHAQQGRRVGGHQQFVVLQLLARPHRQRILAGEPEGLPLDGRGRVAILLHRHQQPLVGLRQPGLDGAVRHGLLRLGLLHLLRVQVQRRHLLGQDRLPGQVLAHCLVQVLQPRPVRGEKHQGVAVEPRRGAP